MRLRSRTIRAARCSAARIRPHDGSRSFRESEIRACFRRRARRLPGCADRIRSPIETARTRSAARPMSAASAGPRSVCPGPRRARGRRSAWPGVEIGAVELPVAQPGHRPARPVWCGVQATVLSTQGRTRFRRQATASSRGGPPRRRSSGVPSSRSRSGSLRRQRKLPYGRL